ncbi:hypothetical protein TELCIR_09233 [Teladorsagia circumcincta]|uniref:Major sperm protein n=1 Tax=Teladorsagia circumcincta TaxID=45464 RepID=A0A2G9UFB8_TELCI|nr:hypothetical protein TELCIR_09233 [Teladorsagia circumcincta]
MFGCTLNHSFTVFTPHKKKDICSLEAYLNKHLGSAGSDEKFTEVVPPTTGIAVPVKSEKTHGSGGKPLKKNIKPATLPAQATVLTFRAIVDRPHVARVQLLLCNISDRALYFKLKSNVGSNVSALPAGNAEIPPHSQVRLILTVMHEGTPRTPVKSDDQASHGVKTGNEVADFLNAVDDRGLLILILILLATVYIVSRICDKKHKNNK